MADITLNDVWKTYEGGVHAVRGVSLRIADGGFTVLVGPSGCGKSTTLRMIAGLEDISRGEIAIGGRVVNGVHPKDRDIAMVFQNYALYPHMTVYQNMAFALKLRRTPKPEIERRVREASRILGLDDYLARKPKALSGGQRQRVALGRAIVREPKAFLFDEPLSNLDAKLRVTTRGELKDLHQRLKTTTVYVTHDQEEAMTLGDRVVVMSDGEIQQAASPLHVFKQPANRFVAGFIGIPPMNFFDGALERAGDTLEFVIDAPEGNPPQRLRVHPDHRPALDASAGKRLVLGVRPTSLVEAAHGEDRAAAEAERRLLTGRVAVVEPLGDQMDLRVELPGGTRLTARVAAHENLPVGAEAALAAYTAAACYFEQGPYGTNLVAKPDPDADAHPGRPDQDRPDHAAVA